MDTKITVQTASFGLDPDLDLFCFSFGFFVWWPEMTLKVGFDISLCAACVRVYNYN